MQYGAGDNLTIQCPLTLADGETPDLTGATCTIYVTTPTGTLTTLAAVPYTSGTIVGVQAPYIAPVAGVYAAQAQVVLAGGAKLTSQPVGYFAVNPAP